MLLAGLVLLGLQALLGSSQFFAYLACLVGVNVVVQNTQSSGGSLGLTGIPHRATFGMVWFCVAVVVLLARRLAHSSHGRSLMAIRQDEVAAESMGVDTTGYKVRAFVVSSFFA